MQLVLTQFMHLLNFELALNKNLNVSQVGGGRETTRRSLCQQMPTSLPWLGRFECLHVSVLFLQVLKSKTGCKSAEVPVSSSVGINQPKCRTLYQLAMDCQMEAFHLEPLPVIFLAVHIDTGFSSEYTMNTDCGSKRRIKACPQCRETSCLSGSMWPVALFINRNTQVFCKIGVPSVLCSTCSFFRVKAHCILHHLCLIFHFYTAFLCLFYLFLLSFLPLRHTAHRTKRFGHFLFTLTHKWVWAFCDCTLLMEQRRGLNSLLVWNENGHWQTTPRPKTATADKPPSAQHKDSTALTLPQVILHSL